MSKQRFIRVAWNDSWQASGVWHSAERFKGETGSQCVSIGYLVHEDRQGVVIAAHTDGHHYAGSLFIPASAITKRKFIPEPK